MISLILHTLPPTLLIHLLHLHLRPFLNIARQPLEPVLTLRVSALDGRVPRALETLFFLERDEGSLSCAREGEAVFHAFFGTTGADEGSAAFFTA